MNARKTKKYQHVFFDLDNTLTRSRSHISKKMQKLLKTLLQDIVVVSGATLERINEQLQNFECFILAQNGNHAVFGEEELWFDALKPDKVIEIMDHITSLPRNWDVPDENDLLQDLGCQIVFSLYGLHAPLKEKEGFDPNRCLRKELLAKHPLASKNIEVAIAGTTSLDYTRKGRNKDYNISRLIQRLGWDKDECVYFGSDLADDDNSFIGVIDTVSVENPTDAYTKIERLLK